MLLTLGLALGLVTVAEPLAPAVPTGTPIVAVVIDRHDVFDTDQPGQSAWPYRVANALHVMTREHFIRSQLLFREGDAYDPLTVEESARILRRLGFLNPVILHVRPVPGGCAVVVETHDQWTTQAGLNYGRMGNRHHAGFALSEANLLGWGKTLTLDFDRSNERNTFTVRYLDPLFWGRRLRLDAEHSNATDGSVDKLAIESPFYSLATPYAGAAEWFRGTRTKWLYAGGRQALSGSVEERRLVLWGGMRLPGNALTHRLRVGIFQERARFGAWSWENGDPFEPPEDRKLSGILVAAERQPARWSVVSGLRAWERQEDIAIGTRWNAWVGWSMPLLGADRERFLLRATASHALQRGTWYAWVEGGLGGRIERSDWVNGLLQVEAAAVQTGRQGWRGRIAGAWSHELDRDRQLTLGADTGLRGWDPDTFDGTSRLVVNLEWRKQLTGEVLSLGIIGIGAFADAGRTWGARYGEPMRRWHADVGVGLLIELTRASMVRIVRLEVALPDDGRGPVFLATSASLF